MAREASTGAVRSIAVVTGVTMIDLGPALRVNGINDSGYIVGQSVNQLAALWSPSGAMQEIRATCPPPCWPYPGPGCDPLASPSCASNPQHDIPSEATAVSNRGQVVGYYRYDERYYSDFRGGFLWTAARGFTDIWSHDNGTFPYAINDSGQITGTAIFRPSIYGWTCCGHAFRRSAAGVMTDLTPSLGLSIARAIDNHGNVVGVNDAPDCCGWAVLWPSSGGQMTIGIPAQGENSAAFGINDDGVVVGKWYVYGKVFAFRWTQADGMRELSQNGSTANAVNRDGYVVGSMSVAGSPFAHATLWSPDGSAIDLGSLGGNSEATAVNSRLQVAGYSIDAAGARHAVRWDVTAVAPNQPPVAIAGGPYAGIEGSPIAFTGSASDPDGDALTLSWSFGDGTTGAGASPSHTYADNGSYTVVLTASDARGLAATSSTIASVGNAAPSVQLDAIAPMLSGESFTARAVFADAGALDMPWRYTLDWGTGTPTTGSANAQGMAITASSPRY